MNALLISPAPAAVCITPQGCLVSAADTFWTGLADGIRKAAGDAVTTLFTWWTGTHSPSVDTAVVHTAQQYATAWIAVPIAILAVLTVITWTVGTGSPAWIRDIARGLLVFGVTAAASIPIVAALQRWMESLARGLLDAVPTGDVGRLVVENLTLPGVDPLLVAFWSALILMVSVVQYLMTMFRDGAVLVLTVALPIAAAGQFSRGSMLWLPKVAGWLLAFLTYKPAAALIYFIGFSLLGGGRDSSTLATALCVMVAAVVALPALMRLVTFAVTSPHPGGAALSTAATATGIASSLAQFGGRRGAGAAAAGTAAGPAGAAVALPAVAAGQAASSLRSSASQAVTPQGSRP